MSDEFKVNALDQAFKESLQIDVLSKNVTDLFKKDYNITISQKDIKLSLQPLFENQSDLMLSLFSNVRNMLIQVIKYSELYFVKTFPDIVSNQFGILSLSEECDSIPMWSHYSSNHRGFIIEFDESSAFFNVNAKGNNDARGLKKIVYKNEIPTCETLVEDFNYDKLFFTKGLDWQYEKEWRMVKLLKDADTVTNEKDEKIYLFKFPSDIVKGVIFGYKMEKELKDTMIDFFKSDSQYKNVRLYNASINEQYFKVDKMEL